MDDADYGDRGILFLVMVAVMMVIILIIIRRRNMILMVLVVMMMVKITLRTINFLHFSSAMSKRIQDVTHT